MKEIKDNFMKFDRKSGMNTKKSLKRDGELTRKQSYSKPKYKLKLVDLEF